MFDKIKSKPICNDCDNYTNCTNAQGNDKMHNNKKACKNFEEVNGLADTCLNTIKNQLNTSEHPFLDKVYKPMTIGGCELINFCSRIRIKDPITDRLQPFVQSYTTQYLVTTHICNNCERNKEEQND